MVRGQAEPGVVAEHADARGRIDRQRRLPGRPIGAGFDPERIIAREPDFGATSVNYSFAELLARAAPPA